MDESPVPTKRRRTVLVVVAVVIVVAASVGAWVWIDEATSGPQAQSGQFLSDSTPEIAHPSRTTLHVPWGTLAVITGRPSDMVVSTSLYSTRFEARYDEIEAPDDGRWVAIDIKPDVSLDGDLVRRAPDAAIPATRVSLVTGGHVVSVANSAASKNPTGANADLGALFAGDVSGYVALPDEGHDLRIRVDFGGVRQEVAVDGSKPMYGAAAPLYRKQAEFSNTECGRASVPGYRIGYRIEGICHMTRLESLPFVAGLGWAKQGRSWLVTTLRTLAPPQVFRNGTRGERGAYYEDDDPPGQATPSTLRYGDTAPIATADYDSVETQFGVDPDRPTQYIFDVPANDTGRSAPFTLVTPYHARRGGSVPDSLPDRVALTATRTITVHA